MPVPESLVRELRRKVDLPPKELRAALAKTKGDVDAALLHLIDGGTVWYTSLTAAEVPDKLFARAQKARLKAELAKYTDLLKRFPNDEFVSMSSRACRDEIREQLKDPKTFQGLRDEVLQAQQRSQHRAAAEKKAGTVKLPPLPPLKSDGMDEWTGRDVLKPWAGYRAGKRGKPSRGACGVTLRRAEDKDDNPRPPAPEQVAAYAFLKDNGPKIADAVLKAVVKYVAALERDGYFSGIDDDDDLGMEDDDDDTGAAVPDIRSAADLKRHIELANVHVLDWSKAGHAYVGLHFGCTWDEEHDLGVLLHKSRVIDVGQADASFLHFPAKKDGGKPIK